MRAVLLGYGGWVSNPHYGHTSILVTDEGETEAILLDSGEGVLRSMFECGFTELKKIKAAVLTHNHGDHVLGLPTLVQFAKVVGARFMVVGLRGTLDSLTQILKATSVFNFERYLDFVPVEPGEIVEVSRFRFEFAEASHTVPSIAVRVEERGTKKCLVYTGDTSYSERLVKLAVGCDLLMHEVSFPDGEDVMAKSLGHSTASDCLRVAVEAKSRVVVPLHFGLTEPRLDLGKLPENTTVIRPAKCLTIDV